MDQVLALRVFTRIAEAGSLARAAGSLDMPRSTVSKVLQDLEEHLGVRLVSRTTRTAMVTPEGRSYHERALRLLADLEEMDASARGQALMPKGRLRIDIGSSLANLVLIPALPDFMKRFPGVELVLGVNDRSVDLVGDGVDCAIRGGALADSTLVARRLCELRYVVCATPRYLERHGRPTNPSDLLEDHRAVTYLSASTGSTFPFRFSVEGASLEVRPTLGVGVNESTAHLTCLLAGLGVGQTFEFVARPYIEDGRLEEILVGMQPSPHPLHLLYPAGRSPTARLRAFIDWSAELFRMTIGDNA